MTERLIPASVESLRPFVEAGILGMVEVHVVATFVDVLRRAGSDSALADDVVLAAALAVRAPLHGHVRVDLAEVAASVVAVEPDAGAMPGSPTRSAERGDAAELSDLLSGVEGDRSVGGSDEGPTSPEDEVVAWDATAWGASSAHAPDVRPLPWPDPLGWADRVRSSPLARDEASSESGDAGDPDGGSGQVTPLVVSGSAVYLDRHWRDEVLVAADLRRRAAARLEPDPTHRAALDRYFPDRGDGTQDLQRAAAVAALERQLVVIAGGPGTGKTRTVARLLAVLVGARAEDGATPGSPEAPGGALGHPVSDPDELRSLEVALAAPTGKAAARLQEAIRAAIGDAEVDPDLAARLGSLEARTLHRLLGARRDGTSFARGSANPITADVVVVDEVSMVSLPLMARLIEATRPEARIVIVGDPFQLASVEAGAVLGDLVGAGGAVPAALRDNVVVLDQVFRFGAQSAIGLLAAAIKRGDPDEVVSMLRDATAAHSAVPVGDDGGPGTATTAEASPVGVRWVDPDDGPMLGSVRSEVLQHASDLAEMASDGRVAEALGALRALEVLAATRRGALGVDAWNRWVEHGLLSSGRLRGRDSPGRPVMVTANDHLNGVFNGDVGIVVRDPAGDRRRSRTMVAFDGPDGPRLIDPVRLDHLSTRWAMTIHKSQGSEFDHVVVALPPAPSPILTRELLYTAVTRARHAVTLVASEASVRAAVDHPVSRASGLARRLG